MRLAPRAVLLIVFGLFPGTALAAWPNSPFVNVPVTHATGSQILPVAVPDGAGGMIVAWSDFRAGSYDVYAQRVLASGVVDPAWPADGCAIGTGTGEQSVPTLVADGSGGAYIAWLDARLGTSNYDIYAHHVLGSGVVDPAWPANGRLVCSAAGNQFYPQVVTSTGGAVVIVWVDWRSGSGDIYAHRVLPNGTVDPAWPANGRAMCAAAGIQSSARAISDGAGGAIAAWQDGRSGTSDIYAHRVMASGAVDPAWPVDGRAVCGAVDSQSLPQLVDDGTGGAIIVWQDNRSGNGDIYAHHVFRTGAVDFSWPTDGRGLCVLAQQQLQPMITTDGTGGAIVAWTDYRSGATSDVYGQHVQANGLPDPAWPANGRAICAVADNQSGPVLAPDGAGGAWVAWSDSRSGISSDVYAHHVVASGTLDPVWPSEGRAVSTATTAQFNPTMVLDGAGGILTAFEDGRGDGSSIYAQRVARFGYLGNPEPVIASVRDVPNDQGGQVKLSWNGSYLDPISDPNLYGYDILRSVPPNVAQARVARGAHLSRSLADESARAPGALLAPLPSLAAYYWEFLTTIPALHYVSTYSHVAPTEEDSTAAGAPRTAFLVVARNPSASIFWLSNPDSGYSVDNVAPAAPAPFSGEYAGGTATLHWNPNTEPDLAGYRLYRGVTPGFVPSPENLVATPPDTGHTDVAGAPAYYKLSAVDIHGNESPVAFLQPQGTVGVPGGALAVHLALALPQPNPARELATLAFALPREARVSLAIFDASGRRVRTLVDGVRPAGEHRAEWNLRDEAGERAGAGLWFVRLESEGRTVVRRLATLR